LSNLQQFPFGLAFDSDQRSLPARRSSHMRVLAYILSLVVLLTMRSTGLIAQQNVQLSLKNTCDQQDKVTAYPNHSSASVALRKYYFTLLEKGFIEARIDTITRGDSLLATVVCGPLFTIGKITWAADSLLSRQVNEAPQKAVRSFTTENIWAGAEKKIVALENAGYPFANVRVEKIEIHNQEANIILRLENGPLVKLDSTIIKSEQKLPEKYIRNYLDLKKGELYNESKVLLLQKKLKGIPFLQSKRSPEVVFKQDKADLYFYLEKKKANYFNGVLGIRPNDQTGKINLTGDLEFKLVNTLNTGEEMYFNWRKLQAQTQDLFIQTQLPYLFNTPVGIEALLKIYKRDSTFTSIKTGLGLVFNLGGTDQLKAFVEKNKTDQLSTFITAQPLANLNTTFYGIKYKRERLDYRYNPRKGLSVQLEAATGRRNISGANVGSEVLATVAQTKNLFRTEAKIDYYIPVLKRHCVYIGAQGNSILAPSIFDNEMSRYGGLRTLRGVDEESIYASSYATFTLEYRILFEENSAVYLFADQGWYEKKGVTNFVSDTPLGFGAGVNFETKSGIFTFNYALGQQFDNPMLVRNAKISFGFRNIF
jgi:outer membrane protein assembly factor BamA